MKSCAIFLSSTLDLQEERNAINTVVDSIKQIVSRCEYFTARSKSPNEICMSAAKACDIFIGIYKNRYGSIPEKSKISVCEMEYNIAKRNNKPLLLFHHKDTSNREKKLDIFLNKIKDFTKGHYVLEYSNIDELKFLVLQSLVFNLKLLPQIEHDEKLILDNLIEQTTKYQKILLEQCEFNYTTGIAKPSILVQYKTKDLYVPPELQKYGNIEEKSKTEERGYGLGMTVLNYGTWKQLERAYNKKTINDQITTGINIIDKFQDHRTLVILGDPGAGKSTLIQYLCSDLILNSAIVPLLIKVRDFAFFIQTKNTESILDYLQEKFKDSDLDGNFFARILRAGSSVIIFDGLDEIWESKERNRINNIIQQFSTTWNEKNKIIITSRINGYLQNPLSGNLDILQIMPFTINKIEEYVNKWAFLLERSKNDNPDQNKIKEDSSRLLNLITKDRNLRNLTKIPLVLHIVCLTFMKNMVFPKRRHLLYSILTETLLSSREARKGIEWGDLDWTDYSKLLRGISFRMFDEDKLQINKTELILIIKNMLANEGLTNYGNKETQTIITNLEERSGLIVSDGLGNYFFTHLSFLEYFTASELFEKMTVEEIFEYLKPKLHNIKNLEIISFVSSLLSDRSRNDSSRFLDLIINNETIHEDIHQLDFMLTLTAIGNGALVTDKLKNKIMEKIDNSWNVKRIPDEVFGLALAHLLNTPYEKEFVELWRKKCQANNEFYYSQAVCFEILQNEEYVDDLIKFCQIAFKIKTSELQFESAFLVGALLQTRPTEKLARFALNNLFVFQQDFLKPGIIAGIAMYAATNEQLKKEFFNKINKEKNIAEKHELIRFAYLADKKTANKILNSLDNRSNKLKNELTIKPKSIKRKPVDLAIIDDFKEFINSKIDKEMTFPLYDAIIDASSKHTGIIDALISGLIQLNNENYLKAFSICKGIVTIYETHGSSRHQIIQNLDLQKEPLNRWRFLLQELDLMINKADENHREMLLGTIRNKMFPNKVRADSLRILLTHFSTNSTKNISEFLDDPKICYEIIDYLNKQQTELKKHISKILVLYESCNKKDYVNIMLAIRNYIRLIQN